MTSIARSTLTLIKIIFLHGADKMRSGVEVMWPRLLEAPQAEEASIVCGAAGEGPPAWDAGVTCPALCLQVKSFQCRHWKLSLTTTWRRQENRVFVSFHYFLIPSSCHKVFFTFTEKSDKLADKRWDHISF